MKPVIALVGRPNVGKSTLFNRLTKSRDAIVADFAGLTRDRHYGEGRQGQREFIVIDTGGFEPDCKSGIFQEMAKQTRQAVAEADVVMFVVDARLGLSAQDHDIANYLRASRKKVLLVANKAEGMQEAPQLAEFHELGIGEPLAVSAAHGQGMRSLLELALEDIPEPEEDDDLADGSAERPIRLAVAGRPNVGKSTLINTWLGEERLVAFDLPGTTRDAITVPFERQGQRYELLDTAETAALDHAQSGGMTGVEQQMRRHAQFCSKAGIFFLGATDHQGHAVFVHRVDVQDEVGLVHKRLQFTRSSFFHRLTHGKCSI